MSAFRIFSRFAELLDINVTRAAAAWLRLNTDGTVTERTAAQVLSDIGGAASSHEHTSAQISDATDAATPYMVVKRSASGSAAFDNYISAPTVQAGDTLTVGGMGAVRASNLTGGRNIELPNASGTLALTNSSTGLVNVSDIGTTGLAAASMLRVAAAGGLEERTAAQVLSDIGGAAASHAASHAGASSTTLVPMSVVGGPGGVIVSSTQTIPPGVYTAKLTNTAKATASPGYNATLSLAGDVSWGTPSSGLNAALYSATDLRFSTANTTAPEACTIPLTVAAETNLTISGAMGAEADTATFTLELVTAAGTDPITIRSDQILDGNTPGNVAKLGSTGTLPIANGGTGAATAPLARAALGITEYGDPVVTATSKGAAQTAIGIVNMTPAAYTALVVAGTVDATTLYLLTE